MRNPGWWRNVSLGFFAAGLLAVAGALLLPADTAGTSPRPWLIMFGLMSILFGGGQALFLHLDVRAKAGLARGEALLARWRIDASRWREFRALNSQLNQAPDSYPNELVIRDEIPVDGIEVRAGRDAIEIDGSIHRLPSRGTPQITRAEFNESRVRPSYIELDLYYPGGETGASGVPHGPTRSCLRFPVPPGAQREAKHLVAQYGGALPGKPDFFHGRGDGSDPEDLSKCWSCGFETHRLVESCPQCGASMQSRRWSRRFGCALTACGLFLSGLGGAVLYHLTPTLLQPGVVMEGSRFAGSPAQAMAVLAILGAVFIFGLTTLFYGIFQMATGGRNKKIVGVMLGIVALLVALAWVMERSAA